MTDNDAAAFAAGIYQDVPELDYHSGRFGPRVGIIDGSETPPRLLDQERATMTKIIDEICRVVNIGNAHADLAKRINALEN